MHDATKSMCEQVLNEATIKTNNRYIYHRSVLNKIFDEVYEAQINYMKDRIGYYDIDSYPFSMDKIIINNLAKEQIKAYNVILCGRNNGKVLNSCKLLIIQSCYNTLIKLLKEYDEIEVDV